MLVERDWTAACPKKCEMEVNKVSGVGWIVLFLLHSSFLALACTADHTPIWVPFNPVLWEESSGQNMALSDKADCADLHSFSAVSHLCFNLAQSTSGRWCEWRIAQKNYPNNPDDNRFQVISTISILSAYTGVFLSPAVFRTTFIILFWFIYGCCVVCQVPDIFVLAYSQPYDALVQVCVQQTWYFHRSNDTASCIPQHYSYIPLSNPCTILPFPFLKNVSHSSEHDFKITQFEHCQMPFPKKGAKLHKSCRY